MTEAATAPESDLALLEEACKRSKLLWLAPSEGRLRPAWHVWHDGCVIVVHEGAEQPLPEVVEALEGGGDLRICVRSKDRGGRLLTWIARPRALAPETDEWDDAVRVLHPERLNPRDGEAQPARWARESRITRLEPTGEIVERPGELTDVSHAAPPPPTQATTIGRLPFVLGRRRGRRGRRRDAK